LLDVNNNAEHKFHRYAAYYLRPMIAYPNAKINLGLNILRKRPDGYHDIESLFIPVQWRDILEIVEHPEATPGSVSFSSSGLPVPNDGRPNLCERAYHLLNQRHALPSVRIHLHKMVPIGAGLGGGSADAAFTLRMLKDLFKLNESDAELEHLASLLGSDCPFFVRNSPQFVTGRGEWMEPFPLRMSGLQILIVYPEIHIGTAEAYAGVTPQIPTTPLAELTKAPIEDWKNLIQNDFEKSVFPNHPVLPQLKQQLYDAGAVYASMTGSGSSIFGIFKQRCDTRLDSSLEQKWVQL
jgi:4-diphosphocytidyl-2-C-methyl-D-erythritol kinase